MDRYEEALERAKKGLPIDDVFPELKESEDERIRKALIDGVRQIRCKNGITQEQMLAYLEKQKEQKPAEWKPQPESLEALMYAIEGKWEAIKPTSYLSRRLEDLYDGLVNTFNVDESFIAHENDYVSKSAEWSEEDERTLESFLGWLQGSMGEKTYSSWLKSLPERFSLKPKQEWSEEDEKMRSNLMSLLANMRGDRITEETYQKYYPWLKSLRPQPHWKPSEEQIRTLDIVISDYRHACTKDSDKKAETLKPLLEQLEKL